MMFYSPLDLVSEAASTYCSSNVYSENKTNNLYDIELEIAKCRDYEKKMMDKVYTSILEESSISVIREGVLSTIFEAIKNFFKRIISFFEDLFRRDSSSSSSESQIDPKASTTAIIQNANKGKQIANAASSPAVQQAIQKNSQEIRSAIDNSDRSSQSSDPSLSEVLNNLPKEERDTLEEFFSSIDYILSGDKSGNDRIDKVAKIMRSKNMMPNKGSKISDREKLDICLHVQEYKNNLDNFSNKITIMIPNVFLDTKSADSIMSEFISANSTFENTIVGAKSIIADIKSGAIASKEDYSKAVRTKIRDTDIASALLSESSDNKINAFTMSDKSEEFIKDVQNAIDVTHGKDVNIDSGKFQTISGPQDSVMKKADSITEEGRKNKKEISSKYHKIQNEFKKFLREVTNTENMIKDTDLGFGFASKFAIVLSAYRSFAERSLTALSKIYKVYDRLPKLIESQKNDFAIAMMSMIIYGPSNPKYASKGKEYKAILGDVLIRESVLAYIDEMINEGAYCYENLFEMVSNTVFNSSDSVIIESYNMRRSSKSNFKMYKPKFV